MPPTVLVTADRRIREGPGPGPRVRPLRPEVHLEESYVLSVRAAGGLPLLVPPGETEIEALLDRADAVLLTGGAFDIHPSHYGEAPSGRLDRIEPARTVLELALARAALDRDLPLLGVCGGMQAMAVAAGGALVQDLPKPDAAHPDRIDHEQPTDPATPWHPVTVADPARRWLGSALRVNSTHHQAVRDPGPELVACGFAPDGTIEVIASPGHRFALGVQWHPELLGDLRPYRALLAAVRG